MWLRIASIKVGHEQYIAVAVDRVTCFDETMGYCLVLRSNATSEAESLRKTLMIVAITLKAY
jgi:hypothetical protein